MESTTRCSRREKVSAAFHCQTDLHCLGRYFGNASPRTYSKPTVSPDRRSNFLRIKVYRTPADMIRLSIEVQSLQNISIQGFRPMNRL